MGNRSPAIDAIKTCAFLVLLAGSLSFAGCAPEGRFHPGDPDHYDWGAKS